MTNIEARNMSVVFFQLARLCSTLRGMMLALLLSVPLLGVAAEQKTFASPEEAVSAVTEALKADDEAALVAIFGEKHKRLVVSADRADDAARHAKALAALQAFHVLEESGPDRRILLIGDQAWPFPIPLVREKGVWRFATEQGNDELINRRVGANEHNALHVLKAYVDAQRQYASVDRNGDGVLEYAQKLGSSPGKKDGLYWPADASTGDDLSPFGPLMATSEEFQKGRKAGDPFRGYYFRILTRQGKHAPGGAYNYIINGRMIAGFAMIAHPAEYGATGVMTFLISNTGTIYQKNLGPATDKAAKQIKEFNPDASWTKVEDPS